MNDHPTTRVCDWTDDSKCKTSKVLVCSSRCQPVPQWEQQECRVWRRTGRGKKDDQRHPRCDLYLSTASLGEHLEYWSVTITKVWSLPLHRLLGEHLEYWSVTITNVWSLPRHRLLEEAPGILECYNNQGVISTSPPSPWGSTWRIRVLHGNLVIELRTVTGRLPVT